MRPVRTITALLFATAVAMLTLVATPAAAAAVAIHVSPSSVTGGDTVTVSGSVGPDCPGPVTLISKAFVHTHDFAGLPAVYATVKPGGAFMTTTTIPRSRAAGTYTIGGRCGGGQSRRFGDAEGAGRGHERRSVCGVTDQHACSRRATRHRPARDPAARVGARGPCASHPAGEPLAHPRAGGPG
jgi:hypothetical protein